MNEPRKWIFLSICLFEFIDSINDSEKIEQIYTVISKMPYNVALNKKVDCNTRFITDHEKGYILFLLKHKDGTESEWFIFDIGTGTLHTWATPYISFNEVLCLEDALLLCDMFNLSVEIVDE